MQVSVSRRNFIGSELASFLDVSSSGPLEVIGDAGKRLGVALRPLAVWFENHGVAFAANEDRIRVEAELFRQAHGLTSARPEHASGLSFRRRFGHGSYQWY